MYICILGIFGVGYVVDWFCFGFLFKCYKRNGGKLRKRYFDDVYFFWFLFGLFGLYYFYLKRCIWGILYLFFLGFLGVGWLVDFFWMWKLVENCNDEIDE